MKIGFVILCYGHPQMVCDCINHLERVRGIENTSVVIVDNCSPDNTYETIVRRTEKMQYVHPLQNKINDGFARGNNFGYRFAREKLHCDTIVVMNSDVFIEDVAFIEKLGACVEKYGDFSIIAPDALGRNDRHSNPLCQSALLKKEVYKQILLNTTSVLLLKMGINYFRFKKTKRKDNSGIKQEIQHNVVPHGCCVIFTPGWTAKEDNAFYPGTFLFCEEFFLYDYAMYSNHQTIYLPELQVRHIGDGSIDSNVVNERKKRIFVNSNQNKSLHLLLEFEKDIKNNWDK